MSPVCCPRLRALVRPLGRLALVLFCAGLFALAARGAAAQRNFDGVQIRTQPVAGKVSVLFGRGGNIAVSVGDDGLLMVDSQFAELAPKIDAALAALVESSGARPVYLANTHWHGDHTGGNEHFGAAGTIVAHRNVRRRLAGDDSIGGRVERGTAPGRLPEVTYQQELSLSFNGEQVRLIHQPTGHTDGDTVVWFTGSGVVHMGDLYFQGGYPFIDTDSGGSILGVVAAVRRVLELVPAETRVIPGHGEVTGTDGLRDYLAMLEEVVTRVRAAKGEGLSLAEILELRLTEDFDGRWGTGFIKPERMVTTVFHGLEG